MHRLDRQTQQQLLEQVRCGDVAARDRALTLLLEDFRGPAMAAVYKTLAACGVDTAHAEEAFQEAILKFLNVGVAAFKGEASPRTYFVRIALNAALDTARRLARTREFRVVAPRWGAEGEPELDQGQGGAVHSGTAQSAEEEICAAEIRCALQHCLERLSDRYRRCVQLYYLEEAGDCAACGELLGISKEAFMQRLRRARVMLADCIRRRTR